MQLLQGGVSECRNKSLQLIEVKMETLFSLRIFVAGGDPDGLRIVDKSNWIGKALVFPRARLPKDKTRAGSDRGVPAVGVAW